ASMEKQDELKAFARMCVQGLSDDVELRQERETELLGHLKEAFAEECKNASVDEALKNTFKRFGDPEEVSSQLLDGNAERLSRNAKIRRAAKWLLLPLLIVGVLFCIDVRGILASVTLVRTMRPYWFRGKAKTYFDWGVGLKTRSLSDDERLLFDYYYGRTNTPRLELLSHLYDAHCDDAMLCALYAQELSLPLAGIQERLPEVIANGRRLDPSNPLYDYLECLMLMREGCMILREVDIPVNEIKMEEPVKPDGTIAFYLGAITIEGRGKLDEAITVYRKGLSKGNIDTYGDELRRRIRGMLDIRGDLLGGMQLIDFRSRERLLFLPSFRCIANGVALYCDLIHREGDHERAVELLSTWRTFIPQFLGGDNIHCINYADIAGGFRNMEYYLKYARRIGATDETAALQSILDNEKERHAFYLDNRPFKEATGLMGALAMYYLEESENITEWSNIRRFEAAAFDSVSVGLACLVLLLFISLFGAAVFAMRLNGRRPFLFLMPWPMYKGLLIKGLLLPALIYFVLTVCIAEKGGLRAILQVIPVMYLCLFWPFYYDMVCDRLMKKWTCSIGAGGHESFRVSRSLNMLFLFVVLLLFFGCVLRPISELREQHYA
ncbi:MAG: hypothetical protein J6T06_06750, partial [Victivallales bacterium]|nr:hypothetical protein [Victivallales bacterium]